MFKKLSLAIGVLTLAIALVGCGTSNTPQQSSNSTQAPSSNQLPAGHPTTTGGTALPKMTQDQIVSQVNTLLDKQFPGDWKLSGTTLSKGNYTENNNFKIVDDIANNFNGLGVASIFIGNSQRMSSSIRAGSGVPTSAEFPAPAEVAQVMKSGKVQSSTAPGMGGGGNYLRVFIPLQSGSQTIGVLEVEVPQS